MSFFVRLALFSLIVLSVVAQQPPSFPVGSMLLRSFPTIPALSLSGVGRAIVSLEVDLFIPYTYEDPCLPIREKLSRLRLEPLPFSLREPLGALMREQSRLLFVQTWLY